jgi:hypothetical protein
LTTPHLLAGLIAASTSARPGDQNSVFSSNPLDSLEKGINQVMGAVFEEAVREAVCQGR